MNVLTNLYDEVLRAFLSLRHTRASRSMMGSNHDRLQDLLDIASTNLDLSQFQKTLNLWSSDSTELSSLFEDTDTITGSEIPKELSDSILESVAFAGQTPEASSTLQSLVSAPHISLTLLPVKARSGLVAGLCLVHKSKSFLFSSPNSSDARWTRTHLRTIGALMSMVVNVDEQRRLAKQSEIFLSMAKSVFSSLEDMSLLIRNITKEAKSLVQSETCSIFLLDREHSELVAEVFEKDGKHDEYLSEIRLPMDKGIAGNVATCGKMMNVKDAYNNPQFYGNIDKNTGFHTRNILCFPISDPAGTLVGVAELCNKIGGGHFTKDDEHIASTFSVYCAISISHCLLYRSLQDAHRKSHMASEMVASSGGGSEGGNGRKISVINPTVSETDVHVLSNIVIRIPADYHEEFGYFSFLPRKLADPLNQLEACISMFNDLNFIDRWRIRRSTLSRFLLRVQNGYRQVPYHNWSHAFSVAHFGYLLLKLPLVDQRLNELEKLAFFVASLCHDVDHRGTNNAFQVKSQTPLAQLYSSEGSVLEHHHFAQTVCILNVEGNNIFESLSSEEYQTVLDYVRDVILSTDIAQHLKKFPKLKDMCEIGFDVRSRKHHYLMLCLMMTASDLSDQTKPFVSSKAIAMKVYQEFFSQGDLERAMGSDPSEMMDRQRACVPKLQIDFLDSVAIPVFNLLCRLLPDSECVWHQIQHCRKCWAVLQQMVNARRKRESDSLTEEQNWSGGQGGLTELEDPIIEQMVLQRVLKEEVEAEGRVEGEEGRKEPSSPTSIVSIESIKLVEQTKSVLTNPQLEPMTSCMEKPVRKSS